MNKNQSNKQKSKKKNQTTKEESNISSESLIMTTSVFATGLSQPAVFNYQRSVSNSKSWETWVRQFNTYIKAAGIKGDDAQLNTFLYVVGDEILEIYEALTEGKTGITTSDNAIKVITDHFAPNVRKDSAMLNFRKLKQISGETIESFVDRLRVEAKRNSIANPEDNIRLQLISGAISNKIRIKAEAEDIALKDLVIFAKTIEAQHEQSHINQQIKQESIKQEQVNQVKHFHHNQNHQNKNNQKQWSNGNNNNQWTNNNHHQNRNKSNTCGMCGYEYPHKGICPAQGKKCNSCGRLNHFTQCCRSNNKSSSNQSYNKTQFNKQSNQWSTNTFNFIQSDQLI